MASSSEAFKKFSQWNHDKTWLSVTVIERGKPEDVFPAVRIFACDESASQVGIVQYKALKAFMELPHLDDDVCERGAGCKVCRAIELGNAALIKANIGAVDLEAQARNRRRIPRRLPKLG